jgi:hypothetical protein
VRQLFLVLVAAGVVACTETIPPWQLDHDRILAVRSEPPHVAADGRAGLDVLVSVEGDGPSVVRPEAVVSADSPPQSDLISISLADGEWVIDAPDEEALAAARRALSLAADAPVPVRVAVSVTVGGQSLGALKTIYLGDVQDNPSLGAVTVDGQPIADGVVVGTREKVTLELDGTSPETDDIDWFTSIGALEDIDDPIATLRTEEPAEGDIAVVLRNDSGGVAWGFWTLSARQ